jgi:hypothetical protein
MEIKTPADGRATLHWEKIDPWRRYAVVGGSHWANLQEMQLTIVPEPSARALLGIWRRKLAHLRLAKATGVVGHRREQPEPQQEPSKAGGASRLIAAFPRVRSPSLWPYAFGGFCPVPTGESPSAADGNKTMAIYTKPGDKAAAAVGRLIPPARGSSRVPTAAP